MKLKPLHLLAAFLLLWAFTAYLISDARAETKSAEARLNFRVVIPPFVQATETRDFDTRVVTLRSNQSICLWYRAPVTGEAQVFRIGGTLVDSYCLHNIRGERKLTFTHVPESAYLQLDAI